MEHIKHYDEMLISIVSDTYINKELVDYLCKIVFGLSKMRSVPIDESLINDVNFRNRTVVHLYELGMVVTKGSPDEINSKVLLSIDKWKKLFEKAKCDQIRPYEIVQIYCKNWYWDERTRITCGIHTQWQLDLVESFMQEMYDDWWKYMFKLFSYSFSEDNKRLIKEGRVNLAKLRNLEFLNHVKWQAAYDKYHLGYIRKDIEFLMDFHENEKEFINAVDQIDIVDVSAYYQLSNEEKLTLKNSNTPQQLEEATAYVHPFPVESLNDVFLLDYVGEFISVEKQLIVNNFFTDSWQWKKGTKQVGKIDLVKLIVILSSYGYFKKYHNNKALKSKDYREFFEHRYKVNINDEYIRNKKNIQLSNCITLFPFIKDFSKK